MPLAEWILFDLRTSWYYWEIITRTEYRKYDGGRVHTLPFFHLLLLILSESTLRVVVVTVIAFSICLDWTLFHCDG
jgi:hypothetical protein